MVVSYKISSLTYFIVKTFNMLKLPYYSLPNVIYGGFLVPEVLQKQMTVKNLVLKLNSQMHSSKQDELKTEFKRLHQVLLTPETSAAQLIVRMLCKNVNK